MRIRIIFLLAALAGATAVHAATFGALVERYATLHVGPAVAVENASFAAGHFRLTMTAGKAAPVLAGEDVVGLFFSGTGALRYEEATPQDITLVANSTKHESHLDDQSDGHHSVLSGDVSEVLLLAAGTPLPQLKGAAGGSLTNEFAAHQAEFGHDRSEPASHGMILQNLASPATPFVHASMRSGRDEIVYVFDGPDSQNETLYALKHPDTTDAISRQNLIPALLAQQPIGRDITQYARPPFVLTAIDYKLAADGDNAKLEVTETIQRQSPAQKAVRFAQADSIFVKSGSPHRHFHVTSITDPNGKSLSFDHINESLLVSLEGVTSDPVKLTFRIEGDFLVRPNNDNFWQLGTFAWFPQPDALAGQFYTVHSVVRVKKPFVAFAPGKTVHRGEEGDENVVENVIDKPVQFAVVHAGKYETYEETDGGLTIRVASYAGRNDRAAKQLAKLAFSIIDYYQYFLGPFPWDEFNIIQVNTFGYGQAPPATMFITNEAFQSMLGEENRFFSQGINERFAHEIAHQYWGHVVKMPSEEEQWLTESFAEYSAALVLKKYKGQGVYDRLVNTWKTNAAQHSAAAPIPFANRIEGDPMNTFLARTHLLYSKGPYLLYVLNKELGDTQFMTFLKSYQKSFRWKFGTTNDLAGLLQFMTKKDYHPFFDKYFWGTEMPE